MPPRLGLRPLLRGNWSLALPATGSRPSICLLCALSRPKSVGISRPLPSSLRRVSTQSATLPPTATAARKDLEAALADLEKYAPNYVNLSRLQLALHGLRQDAGSESIRVAVLGLNNGHSGRSAKELVRLMLADPLKPEEEWERLLDAHDTAQPIVLRVNSIQGPIEDGERSGIEIAGHSQELVRELRVSSPVLRGHNVDILVMESSAGNPTALKGESQATLQDMALIPTVEIPISGTERQTPLRTPVHKAVLIADGIMGAVTAGSLPLPNNDRDTIAAAVNFKAHADHTSSCPFITLDLDEGTEALATIRRGVEHAMHYESLWFKSKVPDMLDWLRLGTTSSEGETKLPVRKLVSSVLQNALARIQTEEAQRLSAGQASAMFGPSADAMNKALADWAQGAHQELQQQLDLTFTSPRWRKLGWWKLFWRVDDVTMLSSEMIMQKFLPVAEREVIYLTGQIDAALPSQSTHTPLYSPPSSVSDEPKNPAQGSDTPIKGAGTKWPEHIPFARRYLLDETIPALQALAQKLMLQTATTSGLATSLSALLYLSSFSAYEAGTVAALGLVWSLGRLQKKWEAARDFWEGEVREEGRKALRAAERSVADVVDRSRNAGSAALATGSTDSARAKELVHKAEKALARLK